jgi:Fuc2NAc and GlcNAc transferase
MPQSMPVVSLILALGSALVSFGVAGLVHAHALRLRLLDHPNDRSSHAIPTPRGGGLGIVVASTGAILAGWAMGLIDGATGLVLALGMCALALLGWIDDRTGLTARVRLPVQALVAAGTLVAFDGLPQLRLGTQVADLGASGYVLGTLGIVWSINLFNFMDGIDGLAGIEAVIVFAVGAAITLAAGNVSLGAIALIVAAATAGFLAWNWPPAKIFMGDVGSAPLGYLVSAFALAAERSGTAPLLAFAVAGGVFIMDATLTLLRRLARRERLAEAHRNHAYQRLSRAWGSHRRVTLASLGVSLVLGGVAVLGSVEPRTLLPGLFGAYLTLAALYVAVERRAPM